LIFDIRCSFVVIFFSRDFPRIFLVCRARYQCWRSSDRT